jgi:hypothetical protein
VTFFGSKEAASMRSVQLRARGARSFGACLRSVVETKAMAICCPPRVKTAALYFLATSLESEVKKGNKLTLSLSWLYKILDFQEQKPQ